jgi:hypothetical protein
MIMEWFSLLVILVTTTVLVTMVLYHAQQLFAQTVLIIMQTMKIKNSQLHMKVEKNGQMNVMNVLVIILYYFVLKKSVDHHVLIVMVYLMTTIVSGMIQMDVTLVIAKMELLIVPMMNVLYVGIMIRLTLMEKDGKTDVLIVFVKEVLPSVLILVHAQVMMIVKKDISVINPAVQIPLVLVSNAQKITVA